MFTLPVMLVRRQWRKVKNFIEKSLRTGLKALLTAWCIFRRVGIKLDNVPECSGWEYDREGNEPDRE